MNQFLSETGDPWLLTPGPLTTSLSVKRAMLHDWGSRDGSFIDMTARIRGKLTDMAEAGDSHVCVPLQGSGTFTVEAVIATLLPENGKLLILINGAYGRRMAAICGYLKRPWVSLETPEDVPNDTEALDKRLAEDESITHVAAASGDSPRRRMCRRRRPGEADVDDMFAEFVPKQIECLSRHSGLIPGTAETVGACRKRGYRIGSTTGYLM